MNNQEELSIFDSYPDVLNVHQVRQALGIGRAGVYKLLSSGTIHHFKIGNTHKIPKAALIEFIKQNSTGKEE